MTTPRLIPAGIPGPHSLLTAPQPPAVFAEMLEGLAELEHRQWMHWSQSVAADVPPALRAKWALSWIPYASLSDDLKELDRAWAHQVLDFLRRTKLTL